jgi:hypothetical protein
MIDMEGTHDNDDEEFSFVTLSAATRNVTRYLRLDKKKDEEGGEQQKPGNAAQDRITNERALVEHRLRELAEWERRIRENRLRYKKRK